MLRLRTIFGSVALICAPLGEPSAATGPAQLCRDAAARAAEVTGVPEQVLLAIALVETGRDDQPWPWTVSVAGTGYWLDSASAAATLVESALAQGITNIDIGCFQLNLRWHAGAFTSADDMIDPYRNAVYAATFLSDHHDRTGDWSSAAGAYHSATPDLADAYSARFDARLARLGTTPGDAAGSHPDRTPDQQNHFPLLIAGTKGAGGSLVPTDRGGQRLIGD